MMAVLVLSAAVCSAGDLPESKAKQIDSLFAPFTGNVPGASVMVIHNGAILYKKAYGFADLEKRVAATTTTNYRLASVTKQFTAMAIMMLAERKQLSFDDPLTRFFPSFPEYGRSIKVRHLLTHTSGLLDYEDLIPAGASLPVLDRDVLRLLVAQNHTYFPPGDAYRYSNTGYAHLAQIVEVVSHMPFAYFLKKNIFEPLGMDGTLAFEQGISTVPDRAYGYTVKDGSVTATDQSLTSSVLGDGGIYSSVEDLYKWDQALYTEKLVRAETLQRAFTSATLNDGKSTGYGFGWEIGTYRGLRTVRHSGHSVGFSTGIARFPDAQFTVLVLTNRSNVETLELADQAAGLFDFGRQP